MGKPTGFIEYLREDPSELPAAERIRNWDEVHLPMPDHLQTLISQQQQSIYRTIHGLHPLLHPRLPFQPAASKGDGHNSRCHRIHTSRDSEVLSSQFSRRQRIMLW